MRGERGGYTGVGSTLQEKRGWGTSGKLITGHPEKMVSMQANFPDPGSYTIEFSKDNPGGSNEPIFAEALITWAVEGNYVTRRVNIADGVSVTGVAQAVKIIMTDATSSLFGAPNNTTYGVACQVARGVRGSNKQPPTLVPTTFVPIGSPQGAGGAGFYEVVAGQQLFVALPTDAGIISLYTVVSAGAPLTEFQPMVSLLNNGFILKQYDPRDYPDWVPTTPGCDQIRLDNNVGGGGQVINFGLTFGIDG